MAKHSRHTTTKYNSSPPTLGLHGAPTSFGPPPERDGQLLSQDVLQRTQALQQRAPLLYGYTPDRAASKSKPQEAIQAEVARQLAGFDQMAQAQDAEILRLRRELDEAARREQEMREHVRRERDVANRSTTLKLLSPFRFPRLRSLRYLRQLRIRLVTLRLRQLKH